MRVIGAGFGRTGTDSIRRALERLLGGRCYHMKELAQRRDHVDPWWSFAQNGCAGMDWVALFEDYEATVDWPCANYYAEILEAFPDAKVLLSVRDPDAWFESFQVLVRIMRAFGAFSFVPTIGKVKAFHDTAVWHRFEDLSDRDKCIEVFERHNAEVQARVPADRLLVYRVQEGWGPLCEMLEVDVPDEPFPHVNSRAEIQRFAAKIIARELGLASVETGRALLERWRRPSA